MGTKGKVSLLFGKEVEGIGNRATWNRHIILAIEMLTVKEGSDV